MRSEGVPNDNPFNKGGGEVAAGRDEPIQTSSGLRCSLSCASVITGRRSGRFVTPDTSSSALGGMPVRELARLRWFLDGGPCGQNASHVIKDVEMDLFFRGIRKRRECERRGSVKVVLPGQRNPCNAVEGWKRYRRQQGASEAREPNAALMKVCVNFLQPGHNPDGRSASTFSIVACLHDCSSNTSKTWCEY